MSLLAASAQSWGSQRLTKCPTNEKSDTKYLYGNVVKKGFLSQNWQFWKKIFRFQNFCIILLILLLVIHLAFCYSRKIFSTQLDIFCPHYNHRNFNQIFENLHKSAFFVFFFKFCSFSKCHKMAGKQTKWSKIFF